MATISVTLYFLLITSLLSTEKTSAAFSSRLIHRFSDEAKSIWSSRTGNVTWPTRRSSDYYWMLLSSDLRKQKLKLKKQSQVQVIFPSQGSKTMSFGDEFGWLHYSWIDIGMPKVPFLVALDTGSDLLWVPCDCVQCAPLSASYYNTLERDLNAYSPSASSTSKNLSCSHQLCDLGPNCENPNLPCPYDINYYSENTSTSGLLVQDVLHLAEGGANKSIQASVILGCGMKQSGGYLEGVAPDGLMGLGLGEISVPSLLAKAGLITNSFSMCFDEDDSGRIFFGDQGPNNQQSTSLLATDGKYLTYIVGVEECCVENSCLKQTSFSALIDSGTSFTFLPDEIFEKMAKEFDRQVNAVRSSFDGSPLKYCYKTSSQKLPSIPSVKLMFPQNNSFVVTSPVFIIYGIQGVAGFCLAIQSADGDIGILGQNFMTGYRVVFDRENLKLGWSPSNCQDLNDNLTQNSTSSDNLPTNENHRDPSGHAFSPAVAGRAPSRSFGHSIRLISPRLYMLQLLPLFLSVSLVHIIYSSH